MLVATKIDTVLVKLITTPPAACLLVQESMLIVNIISEQLTRLKCVSNFGTHNERPCRGKSRFDKGQIAQNLLWRRVHFRFVLNFPLAVKDSVPNNRVNSVTDPILNIFSCFEKSFPLNDKTLGKAWKFGDPAFYPSKHRKLSKDWSGLMTHQKC